MNLYVGIDPGMSGGLAAIGDDIVMVTSMPVIKGTKGGTKNAIDVRGIKEWFAKLKNGGGRELRKIKTVVIEKVHAMPKQGVTSSFNFGVNYGIVQGVVGAIGLPLVFVTPQAWKKEILAGTLKDKSAAIQYVRGKYPDVSLRQTERCRVDHDGMAEAICMAEYAKRSVI